MRYRNRKGSTKSSDSDLASEAALWLLRLRDAEPDSEEPDRELPDREDALIRWLKFSADHVRAFMEIIETDRRLRCFDAWRSISVQASPRTHSPHAPRH